MKILIAVDDSPYSHAAMDWVERMNWPANSECIVVSAVPQPVVAAYAFADAPAPAMMGQWYEGELERHQDITSRAETRLQAKGLRTAAQVQAGDPREVIVDIARERGVDLIVMGSRGRQGFSKLLLGSVASYVVGHAPCSVLVVKRAPQPARGSERP